MTALHSKYSASGFEAAALCPGKPVMERGKPEGDTKYADEGTAAHTLLDWCLKQNRPALAFKGRRIPVGLRTFEVDLEMAAAVQTALDHIADIIGDGMLLSDQRVTYASYLEVDDAEGWGTADVLGIRGTELVVIDYKHGRGVEVSAGTDELTDDAEEVLARKPNQQMALYGLGALAAVNDSLGPFETVRLVISQPRINSAPSEYVMTVDELERWAAREAMAAVHARKRAEQFDRDLPSWPATFLNPNEKSCKFCKAKATCPSYRSDVVRVAWNATAPASPDEFEALPTGPKVIAGIKVADESWLAAALAKADFIEEWAKAVRAEVERRLLAGGQVPGFKLVEGRLGNRAWTDAEAAEKELQPLGDAAYQPRKVISPTDAEKLTKGKDAALSAALWKHLQQFIKRGDAPKHVAPITDPRPALAVTPASDDFDDVTAQTEFA